MAHGRKIAVIGLGYVGLPVAVAFARAGVPVVGFDINAARITELKSGHDRTREVEPADLKLATLRYESDPAQLVDADFYIVTVPTPIDAERRPDLGAMLGASKTVGAVLKRGDIVVYESTVYPGACEEDCVPVLEATSGLKAGRDFTIGYSPERINPGDREHTIDKITKVVSGQTPEVLERVAHLYGSITSGGVFRAASIKAAGLSTTSAGVSGAAIGASAITEEPFSSSFSSEGATSATVLAGGSTTIGAAAAGAGTSAAAIIADSAGTAATGLGDSAFSGETFGFGICRIGKAILVARDAARTESSIPPACSGRVDRGLGIGMLVATGGLDSALRAIRFGMGMVVATGVGGVTGRLTLTGMGMVVATGFEAPSLATPRRTGIGIVVDADFADVSMTSTTESFVAAPRPFTIGIRQPFQVPTFSLGPVATSNGVGEIGVIGTSS